MLFLDAVKIIAQISNHTPTPSENSFTVRGNLQDILNLNWHTQINKIHVKHCICRRYWNYKMERFLTSQILENTGRQLKLVPQ